jgi:hypothetical protein
MCQRITCSVCGKPSFAGCGRHVESVLGDVPVAERCQGHALDREPRDDSPQSRQPGLLERLLAFARSGRPR